MALAIDVSAVLALALTDEDATYAQAVIDAVAADHALVPALFWFEVRNVLVMSGRRNRLTPSQTATFLADLAAVAIEVDDDQDEATVLNMARRHRLTVYDASYLELAQRRGLSLATLDGELIAAASLVGVTVWTR